MSRRAWLWVAIGAAGCLFVLLIALESGKSQRRSLLGDWTYYSGTLYERTGKLMSKEDQDANKMGSFVFRPDGSFSGSNKRVQTQGTYAVGTDTVTLQYTEASEGPGPTTQRRPRKVGDPNTFDIDWKSDDMVELTEEHPPGGADVVITLKRQQP